LIEVGEQVTAECMFFIPYDIGEEHSSQQIKTKNVSADILFCKIIKNLSCFKLESCFFYCRPFVMIQRPIGYASLWWSIVNYVA